MSVGEGRILLYLADIRPLYQEKTQRYVYERLDGTRRKKADACRQPGARAASLAAGFLAQYALRQNGFGGCQISYGEKGQPQVHRERDLAEERHSGKARQSGGLKAEERNAEAGVGLPFLSLSHSGDYAVCAVADSPVGVDIQKIVPVRSGMLRHFFSEKERRRFEEKYGLREGRAETEEPLKRAAADCVRRGDILPEAAAEEFLRLWTAKESYMKLTGRGMGMGFPGIFADLEAGVIGETDGHLDRGGMPEPDMPHRGAKAQARKIHAARFREYPAPEGYFLTACIGGGEAIWRLKN